MKLSKTSFLRNCISGWNVRPAISSFLILGEEIVFVPLPSRSGIEGSQDRLFDQMGIASSLR